MNNEQCKSRNIIMGVRCALPLEHEGEHRYSVSDVLAAACVQADAKVEPTESHECAACKKPLELVWVQAASGQRTCCFECMGAIL